jgi:hypothetical protein
MLHAVTASKHIKISLLDIKKGLLKAVGAHESLRSLKLSSNVNMFINFLKMIKMISSSQISKGMN